jgi:hypothetical protein
MANEQWQKSGKGSLLPCIKPFPAAQFPKVPCHLRILELMETRFQDSVCFHII